MNKGDKQLYAAIVTSLYRSRYTFKYKEAKKMIIGGNNNHIELKNVVEKVRDYIDNDIVPILESVTAFTFNIGTSEYNRFYVLDLYLRSENLLQAGERFTLNEGVYYEHSNTGRLAKYNVFSNSGHEDPIYTFIDGILNMTTMSVFDKIKLVLQDYLYLHLDNSNQDGIMTVDFQDVIGSCAGMTLHRWHLGTINSLLYRHRTECTAQDSKFSRQQIKQLGSIPDLNLIFLGEI